MREPRLLLAAGRALLLQAANPLVAQGAIEHSTYKSDPYGRLERTVRWVTVVCFGTTQEAERVSGRVNGLHRTRLGKPPGRERDVQGACRDALFRERSGAASLGPRLLRRHHAGRA